MTFAYLKKKAISVAPVHYAVHGESKQSFAFRGKFLHIVIQVKFTEQYRQTPLKQTLRAS